MVVRLGKDAAGAQILLSPTLNHISLWCKEYAVDFGNAALFCPSAAAPDAEPQMDAGEEAKSATAVPPALGSGLGALVKGCWSSHECIKERFAQVYGFWAGRPVNGV